MIIIMIKKTENSFNFFNFYIVSHLFNIFQFQGYAHTYIYSGTDRSSGKSYATSDRN